MGVTLAVNSSETRSPTCRRQLGMKEGFDVGLEMSGNAGALPRNDRQHEPRREDRHARAFPPTEMAIDWRTSSSTCSRIKGIYGREMYETWYKMTVMLRIRPRHQAGDHASLQLERLRAGLCRHDALGRCRQGHPRLGGRPLSQHAREHAMFESHTAVRIAAPARFATRGCTSASASSHGPQGARRRSARRGKPC